MTARRSLKCRWGAERVVDVTRATTPGAGHLAPTSARIGHTSVAGNDRGATPTRIVTHAPLTVRVGETLDGDAATLAADQNILMANGSGDRATIEDRVRSQFFVAVQVTDHPRLAIRAS